MDSKKFGQADILNKRIPGYHIVDFENHQVLRDSLSEKAYGELFKDSPSVALSIVHHGYFITCDDSPFGRTVIVDFRDNRDCYLSDSEFDRHSKELSKRFKGFDKWYHC